MHHLSGVIKEFAMQNDEQHLETIVIGFAGDVMIGRLVNHTLDVVDAKEIWGDLLPILNQSDMNLVNLEVALTKSSHKVPKVFNFKADPAKVQTLIEASIDVVNLANNHVLDYSQEGLLDTLAILDRAGIKHVGAGKNIEEASAPAILTIKGIKIGVLGCTDNEPTWLATQTKPGVRYLEIERIQPLKEEIQRLRSKVDLLILSIHWGPNMKEKPSPQFIQFAHEAVDHGVDIIHGHSAHIFQGVEIYKGKLILYDTGDFVDDYAVDPILRNDNSFLFLVEANQRGIKSLKLIPVVIHDFQVNQAKGKHAQEIMQRMRRLSKEMKTEFESTHEELILRIAFY